MNFIVHIHMFHTGSNGGTTAEFELARKISNNGYPVKVYYPYGQIHTGIFDNFAELSDVNDETVAIYCHVIHGNPLNAKRIVRWVIYGVNARDYNRYADNEIIYYHLPFCKNNKTNQNLFVISVSDNIKNRNQVRDTKVCYTVKKGCEYMKNYHRRQNRSFPHSFLISDSTHILKFLNVPAKPTDCIEIDGFYFTKENCIDIFNRSKYFFCYDPCSFLVIMALLCGCIVVQDPIDGYTEEEWMYAIGIPTRLKGFAYGVENIRYAEETIHDAAESIQALIRKSDETVKQFLHEMDTKTYNTDKCYRYEESQFSIMRS